jgi:hypothetical protein
LCLERLPQLAQYLPYALSLVWCCCDVLLNLIIGGFSPGDVFWASKGKATYEAEDGSSGLIIVSAMAREENDLVDFGEGYRRLEICDIERVGRWYLKKSP